MRAPAIALALLAATPGVASTADGKAAWAVGDYARAVSEFQAPAAAGDAEAQLAMGEAYRMGRGVAVDPAAAADWYRKSAAQGNAAASDALGLVLFALGQRQEAVPLLEKAADRNDPRALYLLGTAHFNGDFAPRDWGLAYALMSRAATLGLPQARTSLQTMETYIQPTDRARAQILIAAASKPPAAPPAKATPVTAKATPVTAKPVPVPAKVKVPPPAPATGAWRVQLGAYGSADRAKTAWTALAAKVPALKRLEQRVLVAGSVVRLQAGGIASRDAANALCKAAITAGSGCFPIGP